MNTHYLTLSSNSLSASISLSELTFYDDTTLNISLSSIVEILPPLYAKISWGDSTTDLILNDPIKKYKEDNIFPEILEGKYSKIFSQRVQKAYKPSNTLYTTLTASLSVIYPTNDMSTFTIPIKIRKNDYFENFEDVSLNNVRFVGDMKREYQFSAKNEDRLFESVTNS